MKKQKGTATKKSTAKKCEPSLLRISKFKPSDEEVAKALEARKALPGDIAAIQSIKLPDEPPKNEPIVFSDEWYEHLVFSKKIGIHKKTTGKWLENGWLAYSHIGKFRFINKADIEDMMRRFRRPATMLLTIAVPIINDLKVFGLFCEGMIA
jgi:hypothetical protein